VLPQDELGYEFGRSLRLYVLENIDLLIDPLHSLLVALVAEVAFLPPDATLAKEATAAAPQYPRAQVVRVAIVELASLHDCALKGLVGFFSTTDGSLVLIALRRSRVDATDERVVELKVFIRSDAQAQDCPNDGGKTTD